MMNAHREVTVAIFSPYVCLTITIEPGRNDGPDEVHVHPGGQGIWIARMLRHLGERPLLCGPIGGEPGRVISELAAHWGIEIDPVEIPGASPTTVQDRRGGERRDIVSTPAPSLSRHELDDAYGRFLELALSSRVCVLTGQENEIIPVDSYRRLASDFASSDVPVVGDLHGAELEALLDGGGIDLLKVSDEDLAADGLIKGETEDEALSAIKDLTARGARNVVISRADRPALASMGGAVYRVTPPALEPADARGAGDSMTAGLAGAYSRGLPPEDSLRLAAAAGAANVTRHGLGSASSELIPKLAERVEVEALLPAR
jgi:1-phosphofructokinase